MLGAIALQCDAATQRAQLGWFIVDRTVRGTGAGQMLLQAALAQADQEAQALEASLITRADHAAPLAEAVYRKAGFAALHKQAEDLWGVPVSRTRFVRQRPAPP
ncbi:Acetyltransferase (GNAT) family protein [compost metagenome]